MPIPSTPAGAQIRGSAGHRHNGDPSAWHFARSRIPPGHPTRRTTSHALPTAPHAPRTAPPSRESSTYAPGVTSNINRIVTWNTLASDDDRHPSLLTNIYRGLGKRCPSFRGTTVHTQSGGHLVNPNSTPTLLDVTLRDGGYVNGHNWTLH